MKKKCGIIVLLAYAFVAILTVNVFAEKAKGAGIRSNYSKIYVQNLPIGKNISMKELVNLPLTVSHRYNDPMLMAFFPSVPQKAKDGFEPIPNSDWIQIEAQSATIQANSEMKLDVLIKIPNDEAFLGKKYQVNINVSTPGQNMGGMLKYSYKIEGVLLFSIAPVRNNVALDKALSSPSDAAFKVDPPKIILFNVFAGKKTRVFTPMKEDVRIVNTSNKTQTYYLTVVDPKDTASTPDPGSQIGNPSDVILQHEKIRLSKGKEKKIRVELKIPTETDWSKGQLYYLVSIKSGTLQSIEQFLHIYASKDMPVQQK